MLTRLALGFSLSGCAGEPTFDSSQVEGSLIDVVTFLDSLQRSTSSDAFLIIEVHDGQDFLQFTATPSLFELDFPVVTARQRALEQKFRSIAADLRLDVRNTKGSDQTPFLDIDIRGNAGEAAPVVERFLQELFGVSSDTILRFACHACTP